MKLLPSKKETVHWMLLTYIIGHRGRLNLDKPLKEKLSLLS